MMHSVKATKFACYNGYITQAICVNLLPLLFVTFKQQFGLDDSQLAFLIASNFAIELSIDALTVRFSSKMDERTFTLIAHISTCLGLWGVAFLPNLMSPYAGLLISNVFLGFGGGLTEVMISPLIEACPTEKKAANMNLLHSFYCWGASGVIFLCGLFFFLFDRDNWYYLPLFWSLSPLFGIYMFSVVPIYHLPQAEETTEEKAKNDRRLVVFLFLLMFTAGATELTMSQWASAFAEESLGISKELGDMFGPGVFALLMGVSRLLSAKFAGKIKMETMLICGSGFCILGYLLAVLAPIPAISLAGCAFVGFGVGVMWPGLITIATKDLPGGGMSLFALLALAGDIGCLLGPSLAGWISDGFGGNLKISFAFAVLYPLFSIVLLLRKNRRKS